MLAWLFNLEVVYVLAGLVLAVFAVATALDRGHPARAGTALFWLLLGVIFALGSYLPAWLTGVLVIVLVILDGLGLVQKGTYSEATPAQRAASAERFGFRLFIPVLLIPGLTYAAAQVFQKAGRDPNSVLYVSLGTSSILAAGLALALTREHPARLAQEGRRLADAVGAVLILPQLLAALGEVFEAAGVGRVIASSLAAAIPMGRLSVVCLVVCTSGALFSFILGNSFAAFPIIMAGIGVPLLIEPFGVNPALVGALTITAASCGTLCTPMAANFNLVPAALFEMRDRHGVIKYQARLAAILLGAHVIVLWALASYLR
jgi:uncharacterized membrane protein